MLNPMLQFLSQFLFIRSVRLTQKINASASFSFSVAPGSGHVETKVSKKPGLGLQHCALPGS